eukprot:4332541-Amphidinium_carterae.1
MKNQRSKTSSGYACTKVSWAAWIPVHVTLGYVHMAHDLAIFVNPGTRSINVDGSSTRPHAHSCQDGIQDWMHWPWLQLLAKWKSSFASPCALTLPTEPIEPALLDDDDFSVVLNVTQALHGQLSALGH